MSSDLTKYKIVYEISNRVKEVDVWACSPMIALKKFKEMTPKIVYKNLALKDIDEVKEAQEIVVVGTPCSPCIFKIA